MPIFENKVATDYYKTFYGEGGNGGRKFIRLEDGTQILIASVGELQFAIYKSIDNWATKGTLVRMSSVFDSLQDMSIATDGKRVFIICAINQKSLQFSELNLTNNTLINVKYIDITQTFMGEVSLVINELKTELFAVWISKNSTRSTCFNARFAKGIINEKNVEWSAPDTVTTYNNNGISGAVEPTITFDKDGNPIMLMSTFVSATEKTISSYRKTTLWARSVVYNGGTYAQENPSSIFVPKSINGLAKGRIWVAWHGKSSTAPNNDNIYSSFSDDGGVKWSTPFKHTDMQGTDYARIPSITATKDGSIYILYSTIDYGSEVIGLSTLKNNGVWDSTTLNGDKISNPSALVDFTLDIKKPLYISSYIASGIAFSGSWIVTSITPASGYIGAKTYGESEKLLSYSITTDGTMTPITEKLNGVLISTKTLTSGQTTITALTQSQWDKVAYGKYMLERVEKVPENFRTIEGVSEITFDVNVEPYGNNEILIGNLLSTSHGMIEVKAEDGTVILQNDYIENYFEESLPVRIPFKNNGGNKISIAFYAMGVFNLQMTGISIIENKSNKNILTIEMGDNKWDYIFDKHLSSNSDLEQISKATQDEQNHLLPAVKNNLATAIQRKGIVVKHTDKWEIIEKAINDIPLGRKSKTGNFYADGANIAITGMGFKPRIVAIRLNSLYFYFNYSEFGASSYGVRNSYATSLMGITLNDDGFTLTAQPTDFPSGTWTYEAIE